MSILAWELAPTAATISSSKDFHCIAFTSLSCRRLGMQHCSRTNLYFLLASNASQNRSILFGWKVQLNSLSHALCVRLANNSILSQFHTIWSNLATVFGFTSHKHSTRQSKTPDSFQIPLSPGGEIPLSANSKFTTRTIFLRRLRESNGEKCAGSWSDCTLQLER